MDFPHASQWPSLGRNIHLPPMGDPVTMLYFPRLGIKVARNSSYSNHSDSQDKQQEKLLLCCRLKCSEGLLGCSHFATVRKEAVWGLSQSKGKTKLGEEEKSNPDEIV